MLGAMICLTFCLLDMTGDTWEGYTAVPGSSYTFFIILHTLTFKSMCIHLLMDLHRAKDIMSKGYPGSFMSEWGFERGSSRSNIRTTTLPGSECNIRASLLLLVQRFIFPVISD